MQYCQRISSHDVHLFDILFRIFVGADADTVPKRVSNMLGEEAIKG